ncbi:hypothetical protein [Prevotella fusca]
MTNEDHRPVLIAIAGPNGLVRRLLPLEFYIMNGWNYFSVCLKER